MAHSSGVKTIFNRYCIPPAGGDVLRVMICPAGRQADRPAVWRVSSFSWLEAAPSRGSSLERFISREGMMYIKDSGEMEREDT